MDLSRHVAKSRRHLRVHATGGCHGQGEHGFRLHHFPRRRVASRGSAAIRRGVHRLRGDPEAMSTVALIQARVSSSRFPGKVLEMLDGVPMIVYMVRRAARAATLDRVIVATSTDPSDDPLAETLS